MGFCKVDNCVKFASFGSDYCQVHGSSFWDHNPKNEPARPLIGEIRLDNEDVLPGDKVWNSTFGWGEVVHTDYFKDIISVKFEIDQAYKLRIEFTHNGRIRQGFPKSLFWNVASSDHPVPSKLKKIKKYQWLVKKPLGAPFVTQKHYAIAEDVQKDYELFDVVRPIVETETIVED